MKKILFLLILFFWLNQSSYAIDLSWDRSEHIEIYDILLKKAPKTFSNQSKLVSLNHKLNKVTPRKKGDKKRFMELMYEANNSRIEYLKFKNNYDKINIMSWSDVYSEVSKLRKSWKKVLKIDKNQEFSEGWEIKRLNFSKYFIIVPNSADSLIKMEWVVTNLDGKYIFVPSDSYKIETKTPYYKLSNKVSDFYDMQKGYIEGYNEFYKYTFDSYTLPWSDYWIYWDSFNWKPLSSLLLIKNWDKYYFADKFQRDTIASMKYLKDLKNRGYILKMLSDRAWRYYNSETASEAIENIYKDTKRITKGLSEDEKIKAIYAFVLEKLEYDIDGLNNGDKRVYSWVESYVRWKWVCDGYTRLMALMLSFAEIYDFELKSGYPIADENFRKIGHAWLRIWNYYYDPTFDDPIGATETRVYDEYQYFKLPKDLYYIDRTDWVDTIPLLLRPKGLKARKEYVAKKYFDYIEKNGATYRLLKYYKNLKTLWVKSEYDLTLSNANSIFNKAETIDGKVYIKWKIARNYKYFDVKSDLALKSVLNMVPEEEISNLYHLKLDGKNLIIYDVRF